MFQLRIDKIALIPINHHNPLILNSLLPPPCRKTTSLKSPFCLIINTLTIVNMFSQLPLPPFVYHLLILIFARKFLQSTNI